MKHAILTTLLLFLTWAPGGAQAAESFTPLTSKNVYLNEAIKSLKQGAAPRGISDPICICGGDGEGGWSCTPKNCDSNFNYFQSSTIERLSQGKPGALAAEPICICGGDGEGGWNCTPKNCWGTSVAPGARKLQQIKAEGLDRRRFDTKPQIRPVQKPITADSPQQRKPW